LTVSPTANPFWTPPAGYLPTLIIYGAETPRKSRAETEALADLPNVQTERLQFGKPSIHEEFADSVMPLIARFLAST
jgi:hypothetical protein